MLGSMLALALVVSNATTQPAWESEPDPAPRPGWDDEPKAPPPPAVPPAAIAPAAAPAATYEQEEQADLRKRLEKRKRRALHGMIAGYSVFGLFWVTSVTIGGIFINDAHVIDPDDPDRAATYGRRMMIPLVGPWTTFPVGYGGDLGIIGVGFLAAFQDLAFIGGTFAMGQYLATDARIRRLQPSLSLLPGGGTFTLRGSF